MNQRILIVEDEEALRMTLADRLQSEGYQVEYAADGVLGYRRATEEPFDLILLDIGLPRRNGLDVCRDIRQAGLITPILMLTARGQTVEKVVGLKLGADDYVSKPFEMLELMARVEALLRRAPARQGRGGVQVFGHLQIDVPGTQVTREGKVVALTAREFQLLRYLIEHPGETLSRGDFHPHRGCAHRQPAPEAGERSETSGTDRHRAGTGLQVRPTPITAYAGNTSSRPLAWRLRPSLEPVFDRECLGGTTGVRGRGLAYRE